MDGQGTKWHRNIAENFNQLNVNVTDDRQVTAYSECEWEFTFADKIDA